MMAGNNGVRQIIHTCVTVATLLALTCGFRVIKAALDDLCGLARWARNAVWPSQLAYGLITLNIIDQLFDIDLPGRTPIMGGEMGCDELTTPSTP
jgi:hypothetical protein